MLGVKHKIFKLLKKPAIYLLIIVGMVVDVAIQWPFVVICAIENRFRNRMS
jgi:hypothetical protein